MPRYGDIEVQSRHDFGAHQRNGAESEAGGEPKKKGVALVPYSLFVGTLCAEARSAGGAEGS